MKSINWKFPVVFVLILLSFGFCSQQSVAAQTKPPKYEAVIVKFILPGLGGIAPIEIPLKRFVGVGGAGGVACSGRRSDPANASLIYNYSYSMHARNFRGSQLVMVNLNLNLGTGNGQEISIKETLYVGYDQVREVSLPHNVKVKLYLKPPTPPEKKPVSEPVEPQIEEDASIDGSQTLNPDNPLFRIRMPVQNCVGSIQLFSHQHLGNFMGKGQF